jgi:hypothetical protein
MHNAPALSLTLKPDRFWHRSVRGLGVVALATAPGWLVWHTLQVGRPTPSMLVMAALAAGPACWLMWQKVAVSGPSLLWQPTEGHWSLQARPGQLDCLADLGHWMLLRHRGTDRTTWLPVSQRDHATHWHALRCALFSPGTPVNPPPSPSADE